MIFKQRIGEDPHKDNEVSPAADGCPDIWELDNGDFAIIGMRKTKELFSLLPPTASCGNDEEIIVIPRKLLIKAKQFIPQK